MSVVIVAAKRTPIGALQGCLVKIRAPELGAKAIAGCLEAANIKGQEIHETYMGCVLSAGLKQAPARQAAILAGIPDTVPSTTINKVCGSGLKTVMVGYDQIHVNPQAIIVAGGMESMSNAPYILDRARSGYRLNHGKIFDHMYLDGLEDAYEQGKAMGQFAEDTAQEYNFSRSEQDAFAIESVLRAQKAQREGHFHHEITPITLSKGEIVSQDEIPTRLSVDKIPTLKPVFREGGTVTAANASSIADGAAALILMSEQEAHKRGLKPLARIIGYSSFAHEPRLFTTAPIGAIQKLCHQLKKNPHEIDLYEINEAFAVVTMIVSKELHIPHDRVNIWGGACALGHPLGASGARILVTLLHALRHQNLKTGIASLCVGGGEAVALALEAF